MHTLSRIASIAAASIALAATPATTQAQSVLKPDTSGYVTANGIKYWFEIRGHGEPLLLLHGGLFTTELFGPVLTKLAENRRVIGVHLQGHGRTELGNRKINLVSIAHDLAVIVRQLGLKQVDVMGYSFGGGAAFHLAAQHPDLVRRVVLVSTPFAQNGFYAEMLPQQAAVGAAMSDAMKQTPMYTSYVAVAPRPQDFPKLLDAMGEFMRTPFDYSADVKKLTMPVMLVYGDADMFRPEHIVEFYHLLGGGLKDAGWDRATMSRNRLAIIPNLTHYEIGSAPILATTVLPFLNGETGGPPRK